MTTEERKANLYTYKKEQTLHAAEAYAEACERIGATWTRLDIVRYCANTCPEITAADAIAIADSVRGRYVHKQITVFE